MIDERFLMVDGIVRLRVRIVPKRFSMTTPLDYIVYTITDNPKCWWA